MEPIQLNRLWLVGEQFAAGGFGRVCVGRADDDSDVAIKLFPKQPGAARELLFEPVSGRPNIMPIFDLGEWNDQYVIVMPRAEKSLREHLDDAGKALSATEAATLMFQVANALAALEGTIVHRDLKPENILLYRGQWCISDFGIARYLDSSTSANTHKFAMSAPYASPEQWRAERVTCAADIYAFGVIAFELLQGARPFPGPSRHDFREQHVASPPPTLSHCPPLLASIVSECLSKAPEVRPTASNILERLKSAEKPASPAFQKLQAVNLSIQAKRAAEAAMTSANRLRDERRQELFQAAERSLAVVLAQLRAGIVESASAIEVTGPPGLTLRLGAGVLAVNQIQSAPTDCLQAFDYEPPFDVVGYTAIAARKPKDRFDYEGRSHALWYCDAQKEGAYRWYELAFMVQPLIPERFTLDPFALVPTDKDAAESLTPVVTIRQVAWQPLPFDQGDEMQFIERWVNWFAEAADGSISHPSSMPENSGGHYRYPKQRPR